MKAYTLASRLASVLLAGAVTFGLSIMTGCGAGQLAAPNSAAGIGSSMSGIVHGGPNAIVGAKVVLYATTSTGYGIGSFLAEADQQGLAHQDTDANGNFSITASYTNPCPAGQYAYVVIYGGNTGGSGSNPNSILTAPVATCDALTLNRNTFTFVSELTTIAMGYALSNFTNVTGDAVTGYVVGIGAPAANSATTGCVANTYYPSCTATKAAGLIHAFANAMALADNTTGQANTVTAHGAAIPASFVNALGNILQSCVNSTGGGTNATTGLPTTTTTTAGGTTHDGTPCGELFAYTSYTSNGNATDAGTPGTLKAAGNTLSAVVNLAKHPNGSATLFNTACASGSTGTTPAATCIFNLSSPIAYYNTPTALSAAPPDWMLGISYAKGSFNNLTSATTGCSVTTLGTQNGILVPMMLATDINDNVVILNRDTTSTSSKCYNVLAIAFDGTSLGGSDFDNGVAAPLWIATDSFGHAIVPAINVNAVRLYEYAAGGTSDGGDSILTLKGSIAGGSNGANALIAATLPHYVAADSNANLLVTGSAHVASGAIGFATATPSHTAPTYVGSTPTTASTIMTMASFDINNVGLTMTNASGGGRLYDISSNGTKEGDQNTSHGNTTNGQTTYGDSSGAKAWSLANATGTATTLAIDSFAYVGGSSPSVTAPSLIASPAPVALDPGPGEIDGNNVIWFSDYGPSPSYIRGYDTVNNYTTPQLVGCKISGTTCGTSSTASILSLARGVAIDAAGNIWVANGSQGQVNEIIGLAAPTWPLYVHNGISIKPCDTAVGGGC